MSQVQFGNEMFEKKKVKYTGTDTLRAGYALCYDAARGTAASVDPLRAYEVVKPSTAGFKNFAGLVSEEYDGKKGPCSVEVYVPTARGQKVLGWSGANQTINSTDLRLKDASYEIDTDGTGPIIGRAMQTIDRSATSGTAQVLLLGESASNEPQTAIVTLTDSSTGAASDTLAAMTAPSLGWNGSTDPTAAEGTAINAELLAAKNAIASLGAKVNAILAALRTAGIVAP